MTAIERREEKKKKLKEVFDTQYDLKDDSQFYDSWKQENELQAQVNKKNVQSATDSAHWTKPFLVRLDMHDVRINKFYIPFHW